MDPPPLRVDATFVNGYWFIQIFTRSRSYPPLHPTPPLTPPLPPHPIALDILIHTHSPNGKYLRDKVTRQLTMSATAEGGGNGNNTNGGGNGNGSSSSSQGPRRLLARIKRLEDQRMPVHPIPLMDMKRVSACWVEC
jgi:hypothetical protein